MSKERKRERVEIKQKGIPIAKPDENVIWDDPILKVPFTSNPFLTRLQGKARLDMSLSFGLYFNELTQKWSPITSATMTESLIKSRYYPVAPDALSELSDNPLSSDNAQNLKVVNKDIPLKVSDLTFLDTTKLAVKDTDVITILTTIDAVLDTMDTVLDAIQIQSNKLQFDGSNNLKTVLS